MVYPLHGEVVVVVVVVAVRDGVTAKPQLEVTPCIPLPTYMAGMAG